MNSIIQYGILSTASIVPRFVHGMNLTGTGAVRAIASRSMEKAETAARQLNIPYAHDDYHAILADPEIDAVYIPLPNSLHYPYAKEALLAGKHAICEKPFVLHAEQAEDLMKLAEEKKLFLTEAVKSPHLPVYQKLKELLDEKKYGELRFMEFKQSYTSGPYLEGWNRQKEYGGGVLYGNEAYFFTMAQYLGGRIVSCNGTLSRGKGETEDQFSISARLENNAIAVLDVSVRVLFNNGLVMYLDKARIEVPDYWKADRAYIYEGNTLAETLSYPCQYEFRYELAHYNDCILKGLSFSPVTPVETTVRTIRMVEKLYQDAGF